MTYDLRMLRFALALAKTNMELVTPRSPPSFPRCKAYLIKIDRPYADQDEGLCG
jgi:hypothetical protein